MTSEGGTSAWEASEEAKLSDYESEAIRKHGDPWAVKDPLAVWSEYGGINAATMKALSEHPEWGAKLRRPSARGFQFEILPGVKVGANTVALNIRTCKYVYDATGIFASNILCIPGTGSYPKASIPTDQDTWHEPEALKALPAERAKQLAGLSFDILKKHMPLVRAYFATRFKYYDMEPWVNVPFKKHTSLGGVTAFKSMWAKALIHRMWPDEKVMALVAKNPSKMGFYNIGVDRWRHQPEPFGKVRQGVYYEGSTTKGAKAKPKVSIMDRWARPSDPDFVLRDEGGFSFNTATPEQLLKELMRLGALKADRERAFTLLNGACRNVDRPFGRRYGKSGKRMAAFYKGDPSTLSPYIVRMKSKRLKTEIRDNANHDQYGPNVVTTKAEFIGKRHGDGAAAVYLTGFAPIHYAATTSPVGLEGERVLKSETSYYTVQTSGPFQNGLVHAFRPKNQSGNGDTKGVADDMTVVMLLCDIYECGGLGSHGPGTLKGHCAFSKARDSEAWHDWIKFCDHHTLDEVVDAILSHADVVPEELLFIVNGDNHVVVKGWLHASCYCIPDVARAFSGMVPADGEDILSGLVKDPITLFAALTNPGRSRGDPLAGWPAQGILERDAEWAETQHLTATIWAAANRAAKETLGFTWEEWARANPAPDKPGPDRIFDYKTLDKKSRDVVNDLDKALYMYEMEELDPDVVNAYFLVMDAETAGRTVEVAGHCFAAWLPEIQAFNPFTVY